MCKSVINTNFVLYMYICRHNINDIYYGALYITTDICMVQMTFITIYLCVIIIIIINANQII